MIMDRGGGNRGHGGRGGGGGCGGHIAGGGMEDAGVLGCCDGKISKAQNHGGE